jgi:ribosomal protein L7/L12
MRDLDARQVEAIRRHIDRGQKIEAIKLLRESAGVGLAEAKDMVETFIATGAFTDKTGRSGSCSSRRARGEGLPLDVQSLLRKGREIDAIKALREANGIGLKEAKEQVEAFYERHPSTSRDSSIGPGRLIAIVVVAVLALVGWYLGRMMGSGPGG